LKPKINLAGEKPRSTNPNAKIANAARIMTGVASRAAAGRSKASG
jgi:hypothetical protein